MTPCAKQYRDNATKLSEMIRPTPGPHIVPLLSYDVIKTVIFRSFPKLCHSIYQHSTFHNIRIWNNHVCYTIGWQVNNQVNTWQIMATALLLWEHSNKIIFSNITRRTSDCLTNIYTILQPFRWYNHASYTIGWQWNNQSTLDK